ncbi:zinc finger BED domain-containing protein 5-like [Harmonia axyridis]|uniref:zinc finger BED domain-containing protein 5-like n=1 Tax=Harmonia axyridis TaxID=115357 RepID=UPI001E276BF3|nr:zinc finger BED domain-containing protein 5-like [Harmonia axyridis]
MAPKRKYDNSYMKFGFTSIESNGEIKSQCVICATVLSNEALKPAKLKRHLETVHPSLSDRPLEFSERKLENLKKMKLGSSGTRFATSEKSLVVSFQISKLIAQSKKPHTVGETLVKPCLIKAVEEVFGLEARKKIQDIPLSNNTAKARIELMSNDIEEQLVSRIKISPFFALQCDESTDISNCCQLLIFVRVLDDDNIIKEKLLISRELETTSKGIDVMNSISEYFEKHNLIWDKLVGLCTDGTPAMLGSRSGLATLIKKKNPKIITTHCIIHRQVLASKTLPVCLNDTLQMAIKVVNVIKSSALNTRLFKKLCTKMDSGHEALLFHTEVRWLSKGNMLGRLYELRAEVEIFLVDKKINDLLKLCDAACQMNLAYLVDIFTHLNKLNMQLQGSGNGELENVANIYIFEDKLLGFICKLQMWMRKIEDNNYSAFATLKALVEDTKYDDRRANLKKNINTFTNAD